MTGAELLTSVFVIRKELFFVACDSAEEKGRWDRERWGEMRVFFENDLVSTVLRVMASDERFSVSESGFLEDIFEIRYTAEELMELYQSLNFEEGMEQFIQKLRADIEMLKDIGDGLDTFFRELIVLICRIIGALDGISQQERELTTQIRKAFENKEAIPEREAER